MAPTCVICEKIKTRWPRSLSFGSSRSSSFIFPLASTIPCLCFAKPSLFSGGCPLPVLGTSACILSYLILSYLILSYHSVSRNRCRSRTHLVCHAGLCMRIDFFKEVPATHQHQRQRQHLEQRREEHSRETRVRWSYG